MNNFLRSDNLEIGCFTISRLWIFQYFHLHEEKCTSIFMYFSTLILLYECGLSIQGVGKVDAFLAECDSTSTFLYVYVFRCSGLLPQSFFPLFYDSNFRHQSVHFFALIHLIYLFAGQFLPYIWYFHYRFAADERKLKYLHCNLHLHLKLWTTLFNITLSDH